MLEYQIGRFDRIEADEGMTWRFEGLHSFLQELLFEFVFSVTEIVGVLVSRRDAAVEMGCSTWFLSVDQHGKILQIQDFSLQVKLVDKIRNQVNSQHFATVRSDYSF